MKHLQLHVSVKYPSYFAGKISEARILKNGKEFKIYREFPNLYPDLSFEVVSRRDKWELEVIVDSYEVPYVSQILNRGSEIVLNINSLYTFLNCNLVITKRLLAFVKPNKIKYISIVNRNGKNIPKCEYVVKGDEIVVLNALIEKGKESRVIIHY